MDWENHLQKKPTQKIEKTVKITVKLPDLNKKPLARKRIFVQTPFSHSALNLEINQNHYSNLTSKIMKMCEQILKKIAGQVLTNNSKNFH